MQRCTNGRKMEHPTMLHTFARSLSTLVSTRKNPSLPYQSEKAFQNGTTADLHPPFRSSHR